MKILPILLLSVFVLFIALLAGCSIAANYGGEETPVTGVISVTGVTLKSSTTILTGGNEQLYAVIDPFNATNQNITWTSSNVNAATVNTAGLVTGITAGTAIITAISAADTTKSAICTVTVSDSPVAINGITLNKSVISIVAGSSEQLFATIIPSGATNQNIKWTSSNVNAATVNTTGLVTGITAGTTTVTVTSVADTTKSANCSVTTLATGNNIIYVSKGGLDTNPGTQAAPKLTLQNAIDTAIAPCEIHVASGIYSITAQITMKNGVSIMGGYSGDFSGRNIALNVTTITDTRTEGNAYAVYCSGVNENTKIEGFTINGANISGSSYCIYNTSSSPIITNNKLIGGSAEYSYGINNESSNPLISGNLISAGCGIRNANSNPKITGNDIYGSGINGDQDCGGFSFGINNFSSSPEIINNFISGGSGGVRYKWYSFGIFNQSSGSTITNNTISGGSGTAQADGIEIGNGHPKITNNIIFTASTIGVGISETPNNHPASFRNNCIFNCPNALYLDNGTTKITTVDGVVSTLEGSQALAFWGNIKEGNTDIFANYAGNDYHLKYTAPDNIRGGGLDMSSFFTNDKDGITRTAIMLVGVTNPGASGWSMGAYEEASGSKYFKTFGFESPKVTGVIGENTKTIDLSMPDGTDVTKLTAFFTTTGVSVTVNSIVQENGITMNDFTNPVIYKVTAADNTTVNYTIKILSNAKKITGFDIDSPYATGTIDEAGKTITATVTCNDVSSLKVYFITTGKSVYVGNILQESGVTANNFINPVVYRVIAADGSEADYTVTIIRSNKKAINSFMFKSINAQGIIDETAKIINIPVAYGTDVTRLTASFATTGGNVYVNGILQESGVTINDFTNPVIYRVIAADDTIADYNVTVTADPSNIEIIANELVKNPSTAIDSTGNTHVCYYVNSSGNIIYAAKKGGKWEYNTVDNIGTNKLGIFTSIAIDSTGNAHIIYIESASANLKYATNTGGNWERSTIDSNVGLFAGIAIDSNNKVYTGYYDKTNTNLKYAIKDNSVWVYSTIDSNISAGIFSGIAVDSDGKVYIIYMTGTDLKCVANSSGDWVCSTVDSSVGLYTGIAIDSAKNVHISYYDKTNADLKYATNSSGAWVCTTIDSNGDVGSYTSVAIDSNNKIHIGYYDKSNTNLKYATNSSGVWEYSIIDSNGSVGSFVDIAIDKTDPMNNQIHVIYLGNGYVLKHLIIK